MAVAACMLALSPAASEAALCGDPSGDGFVVATDALMTLKDAVASVYDRRADVVPPGGDGKLVASDALAILKAAVSGELLDCAAPGQRRVLVSTAAIDFSSAGVAVVDRDTRQAHWRNGSLGTDSVIRSQGGKAVVINRAAPITSPSRNSLQVIDVAQTKLPTVKECSVADGFDGSNPQDLVLLSPTKGYVTLYGSRNLLVIDPQILDPAVDPPCKNLIIKRIDLGSLDSDTVPDMDQMVVVDGKLFVSLQLLNPFPYANVPGKLAVIDTATDTLVGTVDLTISNPFAATKGLTYDEFSDRIYVTGPGVHATNLTDGGIEVVNPHTMKSEGVLVTGADLGGDLFDFVLAGSRRAYGIVASIDKVADVDKNAVVEIDLDSRTVRRELVSSVELISDIELTESGELWIAMREDSLHDNKPPGIRVFRISDNSEITAAPIFVGSLPFTLTFAP